MNEFQPQSNLEHIQLTSNATSAGRQANGAPEHNTNIRLVSRVRMQQQRKKKLYCMIPPYRKYQVPEREGEFQRVFSPIQDGTTEEIFSKQ